MNLLLSILLTALVAQQTAPAPAGSGAPGPNTAPSPNTASSSAPPQYQIGPQDLLKITVLNEDSLTNTYRVDADGSITFPYLDRVPASGLTLNELQDRIRGLLANGFIRNPQVRVEIDQYKSQSVMVSGEVRAPGKITMTGTMTVLEALAAAGSPTQAASSELTIAHVKRSGTDPANAPLVRVNWKDLELGRGTDVALQDGDIINVPKAPTFSITGRIRNSGVYNLEPGLTVQQAIAMAGGIDDRGSDSRIKASRLVKGKLTEVPLKLEDRVLPNDVITIPTRFF